MNTLKRIASYPAQFIDDLVYHLSGGTWDPGLSLACITFLAPPVE